MKMIVTLIIFSVSLNAQAEMLYHCVNHSSKNSLEITSRVTRLGTFLVYLKTPTKNFLFHGSPAQSQDEGIFLTQKVIDLEPYDGSGSVTIVSQPKTCGRGFCDLNAPPMIIAGLKLGKDTTYFYCNDTP